MLLIILVSSIAEFAIIGTVLFISAGRTDLPMFWAYLIALAVPSLITAAIITQRQPDQIKDQMKPGGGNQDKLSLPIALGLALVHLIVAGLDVGRFHWSDSVPSAIQIIGLIGAECGIILLSWSIITNRFFSSAVRVQTDRGQQVITAGP